LIFSALNNKPVETNYLRRRGEMRSNVLGWPRAAKGSAVVALDVVLALLSTWIAFTLRLDQPHWPSGDQWFVYGLTPLLAVPIFVRFGLYRAIFRYSGASALFATAKAVLFYTLVLLSLVLWRSWPGVPRSIAIIQPLIFFFLVGASRAMARFWLAGLSSLRAHQPNRFLIFGGGTAGVQTATALSFSEQYKLIGFIDDDTFKVGRSINGIPVFSPAEVSEVVARHGVTDILLALPSASRERRNNIIQSMRDLPVHIRTLPGLNDLANGRVTVQDFRELDVEDLLGRDPVPPDAALMSQDLFGKVVMVTGAGGSIGGELTRQIVLQHPRQLLLLDHNEFGLYSIHQSLQSLCAEHALKVELVPLLGSVSNRARLDSIVRTYQPATVYHAAAYKHVPMVEDNAGEGFTNNVFGTLNMALAARDGGVGRFVLVSTDKAVRPTNVMGATKRMAELVLQALAAEASCTCFTMVRFGNVLDSSGSVVPLFRRQLAAGLPLTVTHAEVTRYFMTIPEAAQLVLQAGAMAVGGDVFVLDMGQPVKIIDLAHRIVRLSGLSIRDAHNPDGDVEIEITGLRPGEKLYEELLIGDNPSATGHARIMKAHEPFISWALLSAELAALELATQTGEVAAIKTFLTKHVQGYQPSALRVN
jgi:FlaA1/EpsC-like NDP-sugar epimerase